MAKSTKAASKAAKAPAKASKAATKAKASAAKASKATTKARPGKGTATKTTSSKGSKTTTKGTTTKGTTTKRTSSKGSKTTTKGTTTKGSKTTTKAKATRGKRLSPEANAQMKRIEALEVEVADRLDHLRRRYAELDDIEPDVGAGEDEGGASFDAGLVERDQIRSMIADEELIMQRLGDAAERVRAGTWRTCRVCKNDIGGPRLEALPGTDLCVSCKAAGH